MNTSEVMKKRINLFIVSLIFIIIALVVTYSIFGKNGLNKDILFNNKNIKVILENKEEGIKFGSVPMSVSEGLLNSPSNVYKIINKTKKVRSYEVILKDNSANEGIDIEKLVVSVNDEVMQLSDISDGVIYENELGSLHEDILDIKLWLDDDKITDADKGKSILINIDIKEK